MNRKKEVAFKELNGAIDLCYMELRQKVLELLSATLMHVVEEEVLGKNSSHDH